MQVTVGKPLTLPESTQQWDQGDHHRAGISRAGVENLNYVMTYGGSTMLGQLVSFLLCSKPDVICSQKFATIHCQFYIIST